MNRVKERVRQAAEKSHRPLDEIKVLAVSKKQPVERIQELTELGFFSFGENYIQEAIEKQKQLEELALDWHFIGSLQSKKIKSIVGRFSLLHSVDRISLLIELNKRAELHKTVQEILLQVNVAEEATKTGLNEEQLPEFLDQCMQCSSLRLRGLMTMPPLVTHGEENQKYFARLRELLERSQPRLGAQGLSFDQLSMGTSHDFEVAIREGATIVRLGTLLMGPRSTI